MTRQLNRTLIFIALIPVTGLVACGDDTTPTLSTDMDATVPDGSKGLDAASAEDSSKSSPQPDGGTGGSFPTDAAIADASELDAKGVPSDATIGDASTQKDAGATPGDGGHDAAKSGCKTGADCADGMLCMTACAPVSGGGGCTPVSACISNTCDAGLTNPCSVCVSTLFCSGYSGCMATPDAGVVSCLTGG